MSKASAKRVSVFIPTYNGAETIAETIEAVLDQKLPAGYQLEFIIIDSGSSDSTIEIIKRYPTLSLVQIPNSEFSHGGTRQRAAEMTGGEFILFLSQDATPAHRNWLIHMLEPFFLDEKIGCVFGRQIPRPNEAVTIKREVATVFGQFGPEDALIIHRPQILGSDEEAMPSNNFFSDVNSAVRRDLLIGPVPFRKVKYAEDQALARDMFMQGYLKAYAPLGAVWHSNHYSVRKYFYRKFDEFLGLQKSINLKVKPSLRRLLLGWIKPTIADIKFVRKDGDYTKKQKLKWYMLSPLYNIGNRAGEYLAIKYLDNEKMQKKYSLEARSKI
jgi:rhamnosyltransferase